MAFEVKRDCKICGKEFVTTHNRTLCCSDKCSSVSKYRNNLLRKSKKDAMRKADKKRAELATINARAKEAGMSYGQYVAMMELRKEREANGRV
jgi:hypothetical protein